MEKNKKIIVALKKARSHLGNVITMVENEQYCIDILQQNLAVIGLLKSANSKILDGHLKNCFASAIIAGNKKKKRTMIDEIIKINKIAN